MQIVDRRHFIGRSIGLCAGALAGAAGRMSAESPVVRPGRYEEDSLNLKRKPFAWPGGATLAVWFAPNVEQYLLTPGSKPGELDVLNFAVRDYGMRVGLWRLVDVMDEAGVRATVALNAAVCDVWPKAIEEMDKRGWEMMGHNVTNSRSLRGLPLDEERTVIQNTVKIIRQTTGKKVRGWLGTGLGETFNTLDLLTEAGIEYTGDWNNDDLPFPMKTKNGVIYAINYGNAINDTRFYSNGHTGEEYYEMASSQFDTLYADSRKMPRVMGLPLHPFQTGQASRVQSFRKAVQYMKKHDKVWFATAGEILDAYMKAQGIAKA